MLKRLIAFALEQPLLMCMFTALFIAGGISAFRSLPIEAFPDVTDVQVTIITLFPGHAAEEVEKQVTIPLEIEMSGLPHSTRMFSHTQFGLSYLVLTFDDEVTNYFARQQVLERLHDVELPPQVQPQLAPLTSPAGELYRYRLTGEKVEALDLRTIQDWVAARYLKMAPGVGDVVSRGGFVKRYQVSLDLAKMKEYGVSMQQVLTALDRGNANAGGSYIEQGEQQYLIRGIGLLRSVDDIKNVLVAERNGTPLLVKDIADVDIGSVPRQGIVGKDTEDEIVTGIILMRKGENPSDVLSEVKARVQMLNTSCCRKACRSSRITTAPVDPNHPEDGVQKSLRRRTACDLRLVPLPGASSFCGHRDRDYPFSAALHVHRA
jgi:cobalt-zinc-cadmium resistance protein CzcA